MAIGDQAAGYRRGLVLGRTVAEVALLVIFVLLLVLGTVLKRKSEELEKLREDVAALGPLQRRLQEEAGRRELDVEKLLRDLQRAGEVERRLGEVEDELRLLRDQEKALRDSLPADLKDRPLPEAVRVLVFLRDQVRRTGVEDPLQLASENRDLAERVKVLEADAKRLKELMRILSDVGAPSDPESLKSTLKQARILEQEAAKARARAAMANARAEETEAKLAAAQEKAAELASRQSRLKRELDNLRGQMANLQQQASGGRGLDHPPCWATPSGRAEYIFDVALTPQGLIVHERELPHRAADRAELPLAGLPLDSEMTPEEFLVATRPLFDWSVNNSCRFVVRAFDMTGPTEKAIYKRHMRILEERFYKYEVISERFPTVDRDPPRGARGDGSL